jgi:uncharacterized protein
MVIREMTEEECRDILARGSVGRLGCAQDNQPYVVPIYLAYESDYFYVLSTLGQKIEWMRANPKVCVQIDETTSESEWLSVVANGTYEELREPQFTEERALARKLLEKRHRFWQNPLAERQLRTGDDLIAPIFFRIQITSITGLRAVAEGT